MPLGPPPFLGLQKTLVRDTGRNHYKPISKFQMGIRTYMDVLLKNKTFFSSVTQMSAHFSVLKQTQLLIWHATWNIS